LAKDLVAPVLRVGASARCAAGPLFRTMHRVGDAQRSRSEPKPFSRRFLMKIRRFLSPSFVVAVIALFVALRAGGAVAATQFVNNDNNAAHLGGQSPSYYLASKHFVTSAGEKFVHVGQTKVLGHAGHFTFSSTCSNPSGKPGEQQVTFDVTANTTADMDANGGPQPAGTKINITPNSAARDTTRDAPRTGGDFDQVGGASDSTETAADGQEVDVFYNDGVNWPAGNGSQAHDCFAGYTGFIG